MHQSLDAPSENDFYEHLTQLIRVFKSICLAVEDTLTLMRADEDYEHAVLRIRKILQQETEIAEKFDLSLEPHLNLHSAYQRFVCRLSQNLAASKAKGAKEEQQILLAEEYLLKLENCINLHRKERNVARLFRRIFTYTLKFCQGCDMLLSCCSHNDAVEVLKKQIEQQREKSESQPKTAVRPATQYQSESTFHKIMLVFNKRFATMSCLDLDYNSYKSYCYMSRNDTDEQLYKDFYNRNGIVCRAINRYSKHFSDYLRRREKSILRKNRFRELKETNKTNDNAECEFQKVYSRQHIEENKKIHTIYEPKAEEIPLISLPALKEEKKRMFEPQQIRRDDIGKGPRGNYQLKSIYLTINKCHDKFEAMHTSNRFMFNHSLPKDSSKKSSIPKATESSLKSTKIINEPYSPQLIMHCDRQTYDSFVFEQMLYQSKMVSSPRTSIIHRCHKEKKGEKRNIRITNLTFRGPNYSKLAAVLDPESTTTIS